MDWVISVVKERYPERRVQFVTWLEQPGIYRVGLSRNPRARDQKPFVLVDANRRSILGEAWSEKDWRHGGVMAVLLKMHTDLFLGLPGALFLGAVGVLFAVAIVSGVVLYGPFMRKLSFGTVRHEGSARLRWLDLHNLLGIATTIWLLVVGTTGVVNTLDSIVFGAWQRRVSAQLGAPFRHAQRVAEPGSLERAVQIARSVLPDRDVDFVAFPGSQFATPLHYAVFMHGRGPLTARLLHPVLIDAQSGRLIDAGDPPWYLWALEGSRPLHFGDYGGMPMKLLWAALDVIALIVLGSGLYLWFVRRRRSTSVAVVASRPGEAG
jgi:uncharacterized iron-regulated membrane protein